jgi:hypothetical protein
MAVAFIIEPKVRDEESRAETLGRGHQFGPMASKRFPNNIAQRVRVVRIEHPQNCTPHARLPESPNVIGNSGECFVVIGHRLEELADAVRHLDQMLRVHRDCLVS